MKRDTIKQFARNLRANPTPAEKAFWEKVRRKSFHGFNTDCCLKCRPDKSRTGYISSAALNIQLVLEGLFLGIGITDENNAALKT